MKCECCIEAGHISELDGARDDDFDYFICIEGMLERIFVWENVEYIKLSTFNTLASQWVFLFLIYTAVPLIADPIKEYQESESEKFFRGGKVPGVCKVIQLIKFIFFPSYSIKFMDFQLPSNIKILRRDRSHR